MKTNLQIAEASLHGGILAANVQSKVTIVTLDGHRVSGLVERPRCLAG